jgi:hypothetical protein
MAKKIRLTTGEEHVGLVIADKRVKPGALAAAALFVAMAAYTYLQMVSAAGTTLYLTPANGSVAQNTTITLAVRINASEQANTLRAVVAFPTDRLAYVGTDASGSAFSMGNEYYDGAGNLYLQRTTGGAGVIGDHLVARVTFKAISGSGSATVGFASNSVALRSSDGTNVLSGTSGGSYTITGGSVTAPAPPSIAPPPSAPNPSAPPTTSTPPPPAGVSPSAPSRATSSVSPPTQSRPSSLSSWVSRVRRPDTDSTTPASQVTSQPEPLYQDGFEFYDEALPKRTTFWSSPLLAIILIVVTTFAIVFGRVGPEWWEGRKSNVKKPKP